MKYLLIFFSIFSSLSYSQSSLTLKLPATSDNSHLYYHELLSRSLDLLDVELKIKVIGEHVPQKRMVKMVERDQLSLMWLIQTPERDQKYGYVDVPITNGLIGQRVILIPSGAQWRYDDLKTLNDLQQSKLVAGLGVNWYDETVWRANQLPVYTQDGEWRTLYQLLSESGEVNYFPRGVNEIVNEALYNPHLAIEEKLLLVYKRDYRLYLSKSTIAHQALLNKALEKALKSGLIDELVKKYWGNDLNKLDLNNRVRIDLANPPPVN